MLKRRLTVIVSGWFYQPVCVFLVSKFEEKGTSVLASHTVKVSRPILEWWYERNRGRGLLKSSVLPEIFKISRGGWIFPNLTWGDHFTELNSECHSLSKKMGASFSLRRHWYISTEVKNWLSLLSAYFLFDFLSSFSNFQIQIINHSSQQCHLCLPI